MMVHVHNQYIDWSVIEENFQTCIVFPQSCMQLGMCTSGIYVFLALCSLLSDGLQNINNLLIPFI